MANIKRNWDLLSEEKRKTSINDIIYFFEKERDEKIGVIAAEEILDFFLQELGIDLYNKGIEASKAFLKKRFEDIEIDLGSILKE